MRVTDTPPQQTIICASFNLTVIRGEIRDILMLLLPLSGPVRTFLLTFSFGSNRFILFAVKIEEVEIFFISFYCSCGDKLWEILLLLIALHHWAKPTVANPVNKAVDSEKHSKPFFSRTFKNIFGYLSLWCRQFRGTAPPCSWILKLRKQN